MACRWLLPAVRLLREAMAKVSRSVYRVGFGELGYCRRPSMPQPCHCTNASWSPLPTRLTPYCPAPLCHLRARRCVARSRLCLRSWGPRPARTPWRSAPASPTPSSWRCTRWVNCSWRAAFCVYMPYLGDLSSQGYPRSPAVQGGLELQIAWAPALLGLGLRMPCLGSFRASCCPPALQHPQPFSPPVSPLTLPPALTHPPAAVLPRAHQPRCGLPAGRGGEEPRGAVD